MCVYRVKLFLIRVVIWLVLLTQPLIITHTHAESSWYEYSFADYSIQLPSDWETKQNLSEQVLLTSSPQSTKYPNFNLIHLPGRYDFERDTQDLLSAIVDSYNANGFAGTTLESGERIEAVQPLLFARLHYSFTMANYISELFILSTSDSHYIGTLTLPKSTKNGIALKSIFPLLAQSTKPSRSISPLLIYGPLAFFVGGLLLFLFKQRRNGQ